MNKNSYRYNWIGYVSNTEMANNTVDILVSDLHRCARCGTDHTSLVFNAFKRPVVDDDGTVWHYWATCPITGDPVMLRVIPDKK